MSRMNHQTAVAQGESSQDPGDKVVSTLNRKLNHSFSLSDTHGEEVTLTEHLTHTVNRRPHRLFFTPCCMSDD